MHETLNHIAGELSAARQVRRQPRHIHHDIAVEQPCRQLHIADVRRARILIIALQVVNDREVVALALFPMHREGVLHMYGGFDIRAGVGCNHAPEQRAD